jgi:hypothetical protein
MTLMRHLDVLGKPVLAQHCKGVKIWAVFTLTTQSLVISSESLSSVAYSHTTVLATSGKENQLRCTSQFRGLCLAFNI